MCSIILLENCHFRCVWHVKCKLTSRYNMTFMKRQHSVWKATIKKSLSLAFCFFYPNDICYSLPIQSQWTVILWRLIVPVKFTGSSLVMHWCCVSSPNWFKVEWNKQPVNWVTSSSLQPPAHVSEAKCNRHNSPYCFGMCAYIYIYFNIWWTGC